MTLPESVQPTASPQELEVQPFHYGLAHMKLLADHVSLGESFDRNSLTLTRLSTGVELGFMTGQGGLNPEQYKHKIHIDLNGNVTIGQLHEKYSPFTDQAIYPKDDLEGEIKLHDFKRGDPSDEIAVNAAIFILQDQLVFDTAIKQGATPVKGIGGKEYLASIPAKLGYFHDACLEHPILMSGNTIDLGYHNLLRTLIESLKESKLPLEKLKEGMLNRASIQLAPGFTLHVNKRGRYYLAFSSAT